ncbi:MAG TPA: MBL fold metallo-hydrolase [Parvularculaceae bacterium]|nr:MBL fold metallo-hydrolase [Parvularculaceae bacterium]
MVNSFSAAQRAAVGLFACLAFLATTLLAQPARAGDPMELEWHELAPGVFAGVRPVSYRAPVVGTTVIVIGKKGVFVFDPAGYALQGERLVQKVKSLTDLPITEMAISHWHGDHHLGAYKVLEAFPKAELISSEFTARAIASPIMGDIDGPDEGQRQTQLGAVRKMLETGKRADGTELSEGMRAYYADLIKYSDFFTADQRRAKITVPTRTIKDSLTLDLGGRKVELEHLGYANTKGDIIMYLPKEKILATGDVVVTPTPYGIGSYPKSWAEVLRKLKAYDAKYIIPGHGEIMTDTSYLDLLAETLDLVVAQVDPLAKQGKTLEEVRAAVDFSSVEPRFTHGDEMLALLFKVWFKLPIVEAEYNLATGKDNEILDQPSPG